MDSAEGRSTSSGFRLAADVIVRLAPAEIEDLPAVWDEHLRHPVSPEHLGRGDGVLGSGLATELATWAPLVVAFLGREILVGSAVDEAKDGLRRRTRRALQALRGRLGSRRGVTPRVHAPPFTAEQAEHASARATEVAVSLGLPAHHQVLFADAIRGALTRTELDP